MTTISYPTFIRRPNEYVSGIWGWLTTVDHKKIGTMYGVTAFLWFIVGGIEALLIRLQLARPEGTILSPEVYNILTATLLYFLQIKDVIYDTADIGLTDDAYCLCLAIEDIISIAPELVVR